jgi:hypothetical protein
MVDLLFVKAEKGLSRKFYLRDSLPCLKNVQNELLDTPVRLLPAGCAVFADIVFCDKECLHRIAGFNFFTLHDFVHELN